VSPLEPSEPRAGGLTPEALRRRRSRSIAIALALGALVVLFYALTIAKLGPQLLHRAV
jgi:hypothetical protein